MPFFDSFSTSLEDLPHKDKRDMLVVFDTILSNRGRFSTFEVEGPLSKTVTELFSRGYLLDTDRNSYPWTKCEPTPRGLAWRMGNVCQRCDGTGSMVTKASRRLALLAPCPACAGQGFVSDDLPHPLQGEGNG